MNTEEASSSLSLQYACGDSWRPDASFLRLLHHLPLGRQLRKLSASEGRAAALLLGTIRRFSPCLICHLSCGQELLPTRQLLLLLHFLNKVQFSFVMVTMFVCFFLLKALIAIASFVWFYRYPSLIVKFQLPQSVLSEFWVISEILSDLPWWVSGKESTCQCRRHGFDSYSGKIPRSVEQLSPWDTTIEPVL